MWQHVNCVCRSVPEIHLHVAWMLSNQQTNNYTPRLCSLTAGCSPAPVPSLVLRSFALSGGSLLPCYVCLHVSHDHPHIVINLFVYLSVYSRIVGRFVIFSFTFLLLRLRVCYIYLSMYPFFRYLFIHLCLCLFTYLSICSFLILFIHSSIHLFIHSSTLFLVNRNVS